MKPHNLQGNKLKSFCTKTVATFNISAAAVVNISLNTIQIQCCNQIEITYKNQSMRSINLGERVKGGGCQCVALSATYFRNYKPLFITVVAICVTAQQYFTAVTLTAIRRTETYFQLHV